jgi:hypothetical protein
MIYLSINKSSLNPSNNIPSFSLGEYYDYNNGDGYEEDTNDSNKYDHCDCLRSNPLSANTEKCKKGLDQDSFNDDDKISKRSLKIETFENWNDWRHSSSLQTLKMFSLGNVLVNTCLNKYKL